MTKTKKISLKRYFDCSSPSSMYKALNETKKLKRNKVQGNTIKNKLVNLVEAIKRSPTSDTTKIKNRNNMLEMFGLILYFNQQNQARKGLKN